MTTAPATTDASRAELEPLRARVEELEDTLRAIRSGAVDAVVVGDGGAPRVYTLDGADRAYRVWVEQMSQGAATLDATGTVAYCNARLAALIGAAVGRPLREFVTAADRPAFDALVAAGRGQAELSLARDDGAAVPTMVGVHALPAGCGAAAGVLVTDLTAQKRHAALADALAALRASEEQYRTLVEQVKDYAIFRTDAAGRATSWNEGVRRVLGFEEPEFLGVDIVPAIFTPEDVAAGVAEQQLRDAAARGAAGDDRWMRRKDGTRFWANGVTTGLRDPGGRLVGFTKVMRDQTDQHRAAEQLAAQAEALRDADRRKDEFLATLAHELRNPLAPVRTGLEVMRTAPADSPATDQALGMMERQLAHMVRLIDDLLDMSRVSAGKIVLRRERVALRAVIDAAVETARPVVEGGRHALAVHLPAEPLAVDADPTRLAQVVGNLLNNAAKYTPDGGRIALTVERADDAAVIRVTDTGIGIAAPMLGKVFDLFTQVGHAVDRTQGGLGIGLSLVKRLVELHDGTIVAESAGPGRGSTFTVRIPLATSASVPAAPATMPAAPTSPAGRRVLVVDDNVDAAASLALLLKLTGHTVRTAHTGVAALTAGGEFRPDIVFLDIGLPGMSGYEVARRFRADPALAPAVLAALTGWGSTADREEGRAAGFDHHLTKPVEPAAVSALIAACPSREP